MPKYLKNLLSTTAFSLHYQVYYVVKVVLECLLLFCETFKDENSRKRKVS